MIRLKKHGRKHVISNDANACEQDPERQQESNLQEEGIVKHLWLWGTHLQGSIPLELYDFLPSLRSVSLYANPLLAATISSHIGRLSHLEAVNLASTALVGSIPSELAVLPALKNILLYNNQLEGIVPSELGLLWNTIHHLLLDSTALTGTIRMSLLCWSRWREILHL